MQREAGVGHLGLIAVRCRLGVTMCAQHGRVGNCFEASLLGERGMGEGFIGSIVIGLIAGWLGGKIMRGGGFGLIGNLIVGVVGAVVGGLTFGLIGLKAVGFIGSLVTATVGAVILLWLVGVLKSK
jgi:uncharacterized membrane protein YeaQ/YmgE (transglycosylase-associated protein family)